MYLSNPTPEPRPAVLGRLRFRTVAKGGGDGGRVVSIPRVERRVDFVRTRRVADCDKRPTS